MVAGAARTPGRDARLGTISDGTAARPSHPLPPAAPEPQPLRIGAAADLLRVPVAAAGLAGLVQRSTRPAAETAAPMQVQRPG